jgi:hypothetical protein
MRQLYGGIQNLKSVECSFLCPIFRKTLSCEVFSISAKMERNLLKQTYAGEKLFRHVQKGGVIIGDLRLKINRALRQMNEE